MYYSIPKTHFRLEVKHFQHLSWLVIMCKANESLQVMKRAGAESVCPSELSEGYMENL